MSSLPRNSLRTAIAGAAVWILSAITATTIHFYTFYHHSVYDGSAPPISFFFFFLLAGLGFLTAMIAGIVWMIAYLDNRDKGPGSSIRNPYK